MASRLRAARLGVGIPLVLLLLTVVLAIVLAGCGSGESLTSKSAAQILAASRSAALSASSVRVVSNAAQDRGRLSSMSDLELTGGGGRARTSFLGQTSEVMRIGDTLYVKGGPALYKRVAERTGVHVPQGTWLSETVARKPLPTDLSRELTLLLRSPGSLTKGPTTTIAGQKAIELKETGRKLFTGAIYIATTGKPYPIEIVKHGQETGKTTFTGWNDPVTLSAPTGAIELSKLKRKGR